MDAISQGESLRVRKTRQPLLYVPWKSLVFGCNLTINVQESRSIVGKCLYIFVQSYTTMRYIFFLETKHYVLYLTISEIETKR